LGALVEQPISTLFQGVSRQPDTVRLPGQVEEADNVLMSVVTGGFEKRSGTRHQAVLNVIGASDLVAVYAYERDEDERYIIIIKDGDLFVFDTDGVQKTVTFPDGKTYLDAAEPPLDFAFVTIADYTLIANKTVTVAMGAAGGGTVTGTVQTFSKLPASPTTGDIYKIVGSDADDFTGYYVKWNGSVWEETVKPNIANAFDAATMPHELVRNGDGTFTFRKATWEPRKVGDDVLVPNPDFVGRTVNDIVFHRDRLVIVSDEVAYFSQAGDYFNFWPDKAVDVLDSDPFGRTATGTDINILNFSVPFRKALFLTSGRNQFEVSAGNTLTPRTAVIEPATSYRASDICRPLPFGDTLYFAADADEDAVVFEYTYDDTTLSNVAGDITKHAGGYVPAPLVQFAGDTVTETLVALSDAERHNLYIYRSYWDGDTKAQSAWSKWTLGEADDTYIHGVVFIAGWLYLVIRRGSTTYLERVLLSDEFDDSVSKFLITGQWRRWPVRLDRRVLVTGVYDAGNDWTTWTLPYAHDNDIVAILTDDFSNTGRRLTVTYPTSTTVRANGDLSDGEVLFGKSYTMRVVLSKIYVREGENNRAITNGRLQLRNIAFNYRDTGYFEVHVTPLYRDTQVWKFTGRIIGEASNLIGQTPLVRRGTFKVRPGSKADTVEIAVVNGSHVPSTITSAYWVGFFNEVTRSE
jgi:hypothetical protein